MNQSVSAIFLRGRLGLGAVGKLRGALADRTEEGNSGAMRKTYYNQTKER
jgi:hypothetical protein